MRCNRSNLVRTAVALVAIALAAQAAEQPNRRELSGGTVVTAAEAPFLAIIQIWNARHYVQCLGTLIARDWVATAAHCVDEAEHRYVSVKHISGGRDLGGIGRAPDRAGHNHVRIHRHPDWDRLNNSNETSPWQRVGNDIALLGLPTPLPSSKGSPTRLPTISEASTVQPGLTVRTIGLTPEDRQPARADWPIHEHGSPAPSIIAMRMNPARVQPGDSGGPTLLRIGREWVLIGITRGGNRTTLFAASTSYHRDWITAIMNGSEPPSTQPPSRPEPAPSGRLTLTLQTENLQRMVCAVEIDDGTRTTISGGSGKTTVNLNWTISGSFRRRLQIECQPR